MEYDRDGLAILKLIAEYKAIGIPTNGSELVKGIPDEQNAWLDIEPLLLKRSEHGAKILYKTDLPRNFIYSETGADLAVLNKQLAKNREIRDQIAAFLDAKPKLQVPHNYDEGYSMLLPEFAAIKPLAQEFCLDGYVKAIQGNWPDAKRKFDYANRLATNCLNRPELISTMIGLAIRKTLYQTGYRIIETNPKLESQVEQYLSSPGLNTVCDPKKILETEFIAQLMIGRNFDVSYFDRPEIPSPLNKIIKLDDREKLTQLTQVKGGDYLPNSRLLRKYLVARLRAWKPFFSKADFSSNIDKEAEKPANDFFHDLPPKLSFFAQIQPFDDDVVNHGVERSLQLVDMNTAILKAINHHEKTGQFPQSLESMGLTIRKLIPTEKPIFTSTDKGVTIKAWDDSKSKDDKAPILSYPPSLNQIPKSP